MTDTTTALPTTTPTGATTRSATTVHRDDDGGFVGALASLLDDGASSMSEVVEAMDVGGQQTPEEAEAALAALVALTTARVQALGDLTLPATSAPAGDGASSPSSDGDAASVPATPTATALPDAELLAAIAEAAGVDPDGVEDAARHRAGRDPAAPTGDRVPLPRAAGGGESVTVDPVPPTATEGGSTPVHATGAGASASRPAPAGQDALAASGESSAPAGQRVVASVEGSDRGDDGRSGGRPVVHEVSDTADVAALPAAEEAEAVLEAGRAPSRQDATRGLDTSSAIRRVLEAVDQLENQPPPRRLTIEVGDLRLRLALDDGQLRLTLLGGDHEDGADLLRQARDELASRGFDLGDDTAGSGHSRDDEHSTQPTAERADVGGAGRRTTTGEAARRHPDGLRL